MISNKYLLLMLLLIFAKAVFSQNDLSEKISLTMTAEERGDDLILVCVLENKDSVGFWTSYFPTQGNNIIIMDSLGNKFNEGFISCGPMDSIARFAYPNSSRSWEYNLTNFFSPKPRTASYIRRMDIPKGKYRLFWELWYKPTKQLIRSEEIIYINESSK